MEKLIADMMQWANVTEAGLRSKGVIHTAFGEHWFHTEEQMRFLDDWIRSCEGGDLIEIGSWNKPYEEKDMTEGC